jgi:hypothetical protein
MIQTSSGHVRPMGAYGAAAERPLLQHQPGTFMRLPPSYLAGPAEACARRSSRSSSRSRAASAQNRSSMRSASARARSVSGRLSPLPAHGWPRAEPAGPRPRRGRLPGGPDPGADRVSGAAAADLRACHGMEPARPVWPAWAQAGQTGLADRVARRAARDRPTGTCFSVCG